MALPQSPRDSMEMQLCDIWGTALSVGNVGVDDDFFEIGGDSLVAIRVIDEIERMFDFSLSLQDFFSEPTVALLACLIRERQGTRQPSPLVRISAGRAAQPLYVFHALSGTVMRYVHFARALGSEWPVWGLESVGLESPSHRPRTIESMVELYLGYMRSEHAEGPWRLLGYSMGGLLAYEAARRLRADGESVQLLVLVDTQVQDPGDEPEPPSIWRNGILSFAERLAPGDLDVSWLIEQDPDIQIRQLLISAQTAGTLPEDYDPVRLTRILESRVANRLAMARYRPQRYNGDIVLFRGSETVAESTAPREVSMLAQWKDLAEQVLVHDCDAEHLQMMSPGNVEAVAHTVENYLVADS